MRQMRFVLTIAIFLLVILIMQPPKTDEAVVTVAGLSEVTDISSLFRSKPDVGASAAILFDPKSGTILYAKNADSQRAPASTTKIMTAILTLERCSLGESVTVSRRAATINGSRVGLREGEVYTVEKLLWGLLLLSGNDAAIALAEHIAGSVEEFAKYMNTRAAELGCRQTHFVNPHGLSDPNHYTTVRDLAIMASHALKYPLFQEIVSSKEKEIPWQQSFAKYLKNTNKLLWIMPDADGVKTGTTNLAGACLVSSATRDDRQLIAVVLNSSNRWVESARLLEWGFANTQCIKVVGKNETIPDIYVKNAKSYAVGGVMGDVFVTVPKGVKPYVRFVPYDLEAPVFKDQLLGILEAGPVSDPNALKKHPVYALEGVARRRSFFGLGI